jgi:hypothetical protein
LKQSGAKFQALVEALERKSIMKKCFIKTMTALLAATTVTTAFGNAITGPSSSETPYLLRARPGVVTFSVFTVGDSVNFKPDGITPYRMVGIPDGLGAYDNGDGTFTVLMNHEIGGNISGGVITPLGVARAHGNAGAFVSRWTIDKDTLAVLEVQDFLPNATSIFLSNNNPSMGVAHTGYHSGDTTVIQRTCSADLAPPTAYAWTDPATGTFYGTDARIFQTGEESSGFATSVSGGGDLGPEARVDFGRQWNMIATDDSRIDGDQSRTAFEMPHCGLFSWENNLANPLSQRITITAGMDDTSPAGQVYFWVGEKQTTGNVVERAGLTRQSERDNLHVVRVDGLAPDVTGATNEDRNTPLSGTFSLENLGDVSGLTADGLETLSDTEHGTQFLRPEDGNWDPSNPSDFYFVTTDRYDQLKDGVGTQVGRSRLYRLRFTDITHPELGGTIACLLNGTEVGNMFDNITITLRGSIFLQEDVGNQAHNGKIWRYSINKGTLELVARHDLARFGDIGVAATPPFNQDEESSGIVQVYDILGEGWFLCDVQAHYNPGDAELVEGGQLVAIHFPPGQEK